MAKQNSLKVTDCCVCMLLPLALITLRFPLCHKYRLLTSCCALERERARVREREDTN